MLIGYARTSTADQIAGFEAQLEELQLAGCEKIFSEKASAVAQRAQLQTAIEFVRENDILVITKIDRLVRSIVELLGIIERLALKKVKLRILNLGIDTQTPTGTLMLTVLGAVAQFERDIMLERQREGVAKAKAAGKYKGRRPIALDRQREVIRLASEGMAKARVAREVGVGEATVYRILKAASAGLK